MKLWFQPTFAGNFQTSPVKSLDASCEDLRFGSEVSPLSDLRCRNPYRMGPLIIDNYGIHT